MFCNVVTGPPALAGEEKMAATRVGLARNRRWFDLERENAEAGWPGPNWTDGHVHVSFRHRRDEIVVHHRGLIEPGPWFLGTRERGPGEKGE